MGKKILYLEDLYNFYSNYKKSTHYSVDDKHEPIVVQTHGKIKFADNSDGSKDGLTPVHLQACHTEENVNGSNIDFSVMDKALPSFQNRPILGYIHIVDGKPCFKNHAMHEENGELVYDEVPVGIIPESCNAKLVYDESKGKTYVEVDGYIFDEYSKATEILEREEELAVSVELSIRSLSYDAKNKYLNIEDFFFSGVTILQCDEDGNEVKPGMAGSNIKLSDFSKDNNSLFEKVESLQEQINEILSRYEINTNAKGGQEMEFEEEVTEVTEETTSEAEVTETEAEVEVVNEEVKETVETEEVETVESEAETTETEEETVETEEVVEVEKMSRTFEISHDDIRYALYNLLVRYEESDNEWYCIVDVYDNRFVYQSFFNSDKIWGQAYVKDGDNISFDGERYELYRELLTASEKAELDSMRANYSALVEYKENVEKNELHNKREAILLNEKYSVIATKDEDGNFENKAYAELYAKMDDYSIEELDREAKVILGEYAINGGKFSAKAEPKPTVKVFSNMNRKKVKKNYGDLFD